MGATSYAHALISIIPDVLDSLNIAISNATAAEAPTSANDDGTLALASSLRESVGCVQESLHSGGERVSEEILEALYDSVECCRLLASAFSLGPRSEIKGDGARSTAGSTPKRGGRTLKIARRVLESMEFLCDNVHLKECSLDQRRQRKCTRVIGDDYQSLTLLLHDRRQEKDQGCWGARPTSFPGLSDPSQLSTKLRGARDSLDVLSCGGLGSPEARRSRSIDRQLRDEQLQPWTRSDCVMAPQTLQWVGMFKPSLAAFTCDDRQQHMDKLRREVVRHVHRFINDDKCRDETSMPEEALLIAAELRARVAKTTETLTDEELDLFERLWGLEAFRSTANDLGYSSWVGDASLVTDVLGKARKIMRNDDYVLTVGDATFALRGEAWNYLSHFTQGRRKVSIVDWRGNPSLRKGWRQRFGRTPTFIALFDLSTYDHVYPDMLEHSSFSEYLETFDLAIRDPCFRDTTFVLYLVNVTQFREKLRRVPMADHAPGFAGGDDPDEAASYILRQFTARAEGRHRVRVRICDYVDPLNVDFLFTSVDHAVRQRQIVKRLRGYDPALPKARFVCTRCGRHAPRVPY